MVCICALLALGIHPARAEQVIRTEIKAIDIDAGPGVDANRVRSLLKLRVGDQVTDEAVDQALRDLWSLGDIRPPEIERQPVPGGYKLIVHVRKLPVVDTIEFKGNVGLDVDLLRKQLAHPVGNATDLQGFDADQVIIEKFYRERQYPLVKMSHEAVEKDGKWQVTYTVESGPKLAVAKVRFEGNLSLKEKELSDLMVTQAGGIFTKGKYDPATFQTDLFVIAEYYHTRGWLDAKVTSRIDTDAAAGQLFPVVVIDEGPRYRVDQVVILGTKLFPAKQITPQLKLKSGDFFSEVTLDDDIATMQHMYEKKGHISADIEKNLLFSEKAPVVTVEINVVSEGPAAVIGKVVIRGNNVTQDHVIRRYITIHPGDPVDPTKLDTVRQRLLDTGYFNVPEGGTGKAVDVFLENGATPETKNLVVTVNDDVHGRVTVGAMWNSDFGPMGLVELVHNNFDISDLPKDWQDFWNGTAFAGGGQQFSIRLAPGVNYSDFRIAWSEPSVQDTPNFVGTEVYMNKWATDQGYDRARTGFDVTVGRRFLDDALSVSLTPGIEQLTISNVSKGAGKDILDAKGSHALRTLNLNVTYDKRDSRLDPSSGYVASVDLTDVGGILGGDVDVLKARVRGAYYVTVLDTPELGKHVVSLSGALGGMKSLKGDKVPFFERWMVGGTSDNPLRGFEFDGIGPVQGKDKDHVGGEFMAIGSAQYQFPLYKEILRGVFFTDVGNLGHSLGDLKLSTMRVAVGVGLRVRLFGGQAGPIAIDFGFPIKKQSTDKKQIISFSVGGTYQF